jgi:hypothetical protein
LIANHSPVSTPSPINPTSTGSKSATSTRTTPRVSRASRRDHIQSADAALTTIARFRAGQIPLAKGGEEIGGSGLESRRDMEQSTG